MNMGARSSLLAQSRSYAVGMRCAAQNHTPTDVIALYLVLTVCAAHGLLVRAQEVVPVPSPLSAQRSLCPGDRFGRAGHRDAREPRKCDDLALPQAHAVG